MTDFTSEVRKPVSIKTIAKRMERVLIEFETNGNTHAYDDELAASSSATHKLPYTTHHGLENQPDILEFATQTAVKSADINRNHQSDDRPDGIRLRPRPLSRKNNIGPACSRNNKHKNRRPDHTTERTHSDIENESTSNARITLKDRSRKPSNRHNHHQTKQN